MSIKLFIIELTIVKSSSYTIDFEILKLVLKFMPPIGDRSPQQI